MYPYVSIVQVQKGLGWGSSGKDQTVLEQVSIRVLVKKEEL